MGDPAFIQNLKRAVGRDYALHLHRGLKIQINGDQIKGWDIEMRGSDKFAPMRVEYREKSDHGVVSVEILAGMAVPPPASSDPADQDEKESRSGWYVVCNGRIVVAADKTIASGWGSDDWPKWHPQYEGFLGIILFSSENAALLPLTTTKRSVDSSSVVYRHAMPRMRDVSKQWIAYTNVRRLTLEEAKRLEMAAKPVAVYNIKKREAVALPALVAKAKIDQANISYPMQRKRVRALADEFGDINMTYRDVGLRSFEYAYADLVGED
jgi:hypothetical protein